MNYKRHLFVTIFPYLQNKNKLMEHVDIILDTFESILTQLIIQSI